MKLVGICRCDARPAHAEGDCCCSDEISSCCPKHGGNSSQNNNRKPCCAYTPADGLTAFAPDMPSIDMHVDCVPIAIVSAQEFALDGFVPSVRAALAGDSPQQPDTPLYLRVHSFLI